MLSGDLVLDAGYSLNPLLDVGQIEGAFVMGLGHYMSETVYYNSDGALESAGTFEYKVQLLSYRGAFTIITPAVSTAAADT